MLDRIKPETRTSIFYFTQFMGSAAAVVYGSIWMTLKGITPQEIGIINSAPVLIMLVLNLVVGRIADRAKDWRQVIVVGALMAGFIPFGLLYVHEFWGVLIIWTLQSLPVAAIGPVSDAAAIRMTKRNGTDFGFIRAMGTLGYLLIVALTGYVITWFGSDSFAVLFIVVSLMRSVVALGLPRFRAPDRQPVIATVGKAGTAFRDLLRPWFLLPLVGYAMVFGTHIILNAFAALLWKEQGIAESVIGPLLALGAIAEASMMFLYKRIGARFSARKLILISALASAARWIIMAFSPPVAVLVPLQLTHSVTFALGYLGSVNFIANATSEDIAAEAQSFFVVLQQAMSVIALTGFGWLVGLIGAHSYFVAGLFALIGAGCIHWSLRLAEPGSKLGDAAASM